MESVMAEGVIGGSGDPGVEPGPWQESATGWLDTVHGAETTTVDATIASAGVAAFEADRSARLYLIGTAAAVILSILLASLLARRINRRLQRLTTAANQLATVELPRLVDDLRSPGQGREAAEPITPLEVDSRDEIGQLAEAFNAIQQVTSQVAEDQAALLRRGIADIFVHLARRNQSLLDRQIEFIDSLEAQEQDPDQLENLFKLDHLATRMRRNAESLLVLAGAEPPRRRSRPVDLADIVRVAVGEVEDFTRINLRALDEATVGGHAAVDLAHLLSELMENATQFSPPESTVEVIGATTADGGYAITILDHGIGMSADQLAEANELLSEPPPVGLALSRSLGFIVVGRLARRLQVVVRLGATAGSGVTAVVQLPAEVLAGGADERPVAPAFAPTPGPNALAPAHLSEALPAGEDFERGLAALVGSDTTPESTSEEDHEAFWGKDDHGTGDEFIADLAATAEVLAPPPAAPVTDAGLPGRGPAIEEPPTTPAPESFVPPSPPPPPSEPAWEPAPDWFDGDLSDAPAPGPGAQPAPEPVATAPAGRATPLARRKPLATLTEEPTIRPSGRSASTRRSPEEVRAMLSRYRRGIQDGRTSAPGTED
jgi:signal transduction histidine kinase